MTNRQEWKIKAPSDNQISKVLWETQKSTYSVIKEVTYSSLKAALMHWRDNWNEKRFRPFMFLVSRSLSSLIAIMRKSSKGSKASVKAEQPPGEFYHTFLYLYVVTCSTVPFNYCKFSFLGKQPMIRAFGEAIGQDLILSRYPGQDFLFCPVLIVSSLNSNLRSHQLLSDDNLNADK